MEPTAADPARSVSPIRVGPEEGARKSPQPRKPPGGHAQQPPAKMKRTSSTRAHVAAAIAAAAEALGVGSGPQAQRGDGDAAEAAVTAAAPSKPVSVSKPVVTAAPQSPPSVAARALKDRAGAAPSSDAHHGGSAPPPTPPSRGSQRTDGASQSRRGSVSGGVEECIRVLVRVRPISRKELQGAGAGAALEVDGNAVAVKQPTRGILKCVYDKVLGPATTQVRFRGCVALRGVRMIIPGGVACMWCCWRRRRCSRSCRAAWMACFEASTAPFLRTAKRELARRTPCWVPRWRPKWPSARCLHA